MQIHASSTAGHPLQGCCARDQHCPSTERGTGKRKQFTTNLMPVGAFTMTELVKQDIMLAPYCRDHLATSD